MPNEEYFTSYVLEFSFSYFGRDFATALRSSLRFRTTCAAGEIIVRSLNLDRENGYSKRDRNLLACSYFPIVILSNDPAYYVALLEFRSEYGDLGKLWLHRECLRLSQ